MSDGEIKIRDLIQIDPSTGHAHVGPPPPPLIWTEQLMEVGPEVGPLQFELHSHQRHFYDWIDSNRGPGPRIFMAKSRRVGVGAMLTRELRRMWLECVLGPDVEASENGMGC